MYIDNVDSEIQKKDIIILHILKEALNNEEY